MNNIEILEKFIEEYNANYPEEKDWVVIYPEEIEALKNLIQEYKENLMKNTIPKSKVKEKIEELEEQLKYNLFKNHEIYTVVENKLKYKIEVLQQLLEEGE